MKKVLLMLFTVAIAALATSAVAPAGTMGSAAAPMATLVTPDQIKWMPAKGLPGAQIAVMYGDPMKAGSTYTMRLKLPSGYKFAPHWHPDTERVTVLSGTVVVGAGAVMDVSKGATLGAGSFIVVPAKLVHWLVSKTPSVLQASGVGPFTMTLAK